MNHELNNEHYDLIIRHLDGSASPEEERLFQLWLNDHSDNQRVFDSIKSMWESAANAAVFEQIDIEKDWETVKKSLSNKQQKPVAKIRPLRWAAGIAAGLAILLLSYMASLNFSSEQGIREIALSDGSKVWLNQNAAFDYPKSFSGAERTVALTGEAFFEIAENAEKPFIINTPESRIRVLGTSFNVKTDAEKTEVIVATGKVELSDPDDPEKKVELTKDLRGIHQGETLTSQSNDNPNYLAWRTGAFTFEGTPVAKALSEISAVSAKPVRLESGFTSDCLLRASFEKEEVSAMLETIALSCGLRVKEYDNAFVLSGSIK